MGRPPEEIDPFDPTDFVDISESAPTRAHPQALSYELGAGSLVGDYRVEGKIGEGGMGVVYAAVHPLIGKRAAIKVLQRELCTDRTALARFIDEARVVNKIGHPNIVDIFTLGQLPDGRSYLVMEWLSGETLRARIARARPDLDETCYILRSLVRALDAAHEKGVVHRDLKPDNVFLVAVRGDRPMVKLLDFGIAKLVHADHRIERTASNQMIGTPLYIAPEQARAETVDHRADIYALGAMAFEMVVGRPPYDGKSAMEVIAKHMMEPAVRPSARVQGLPRDLDDIIYAMLAKDPHARPTLADFAVILDHLATSLQQDPPVLRGSMPVLDRVAPTIGADGPPTVGDRPQRMAAYATPPAIAPQATPSPSYAHAPVLAMSSPDLAPKRRWLLPVVGAVCLAGGVAIAVLVMGGRGPTSIDSTPEPAKPAVAEPAAPVEAKSASTSNETKPVEPKPVEPAAEPEPVAPRKPIDPATEPKSESVETTAEIKTEPAKPGIASRPKTVPKKRPPPKKPATKPTGDDEMLLMPGSLSRGKQ